MGKQRPATLLIGAGGIGMLVGSVVADLDLRPVLVVVAVGLGLAAWHRLRFGTGKLFVIGILAAASVLFSIADFGTGEPVWSSSEYTGAESVGIWTFIASGVVVLIGVVWSSVRERPAESPSLWSYVFGKGAPSASARRSSPRSRAGRAGNGRRWRAPTGPRSPAPPAHRR